jgi:polysaccharide biosynthesis transport protein
VNKETTMSTEQLIAILLYRWRIISVLMVAGLICASLFYLVRPASYTAETTLYVAARADASATSAYDGNLLSQQRIKSYEELVTSPRITGQVVSDLKLPDSPDELASELSASSAVESIVMTVKATQGTPDGAASVANSAANSLIQVVNDLEKPRTPGAVQPVEIRVVQPASAPERASNAGLWTTLMIGLLVGLILGATFSLLRFIIDKSVKAHDELANLVSAPYLGSVPYDSSVAGNTPQQVIAGNSVAAEAVRQIRTSVQFLEIDRESRVFAVTSAVESEGKTTTAAYLAVALASTGQKVTLVEGDLRRPSLATAFGLDAAVGLTSVLSRRVSLQDAVLSTGTPGLAILPAGHLPPNPSELLGSSQMKQVIEGLRDRSDIVLIDTPPLVPVTDAAAMAECVDGYLLVCKAGKTTVTQVASAMRMLEPLSKAVVGGILTMTRQDKSGGYERYSSYVDPNRASAAIDTRDAEGNAGSYSRPTPSPSPRPSGRAHRAQG